VSAGGRCSRSAQWRRPKVAVVLTASRQVVKYLCCRRSTLSERLGRVLQSLKIREGWGLPNAQPIGALSCFSSIVAESSTIRVFDTPMHVYLRPRWGSTQEICRWPGPCERNKVDDDSRLAETSRPLTVPSFSNPRSSSHPGLEAVRSKLRVRGFLLVNCR
jgi:hypothetical protein